MRRNEAILHIDGQEKSRCELELIIHYYSETERIFTELKQGV